MNSAWELLVQVTAEEVGRAEFNVATPTYATIAYSEQRMVIHKQNSLKITSKRGSRLNLNEFLVKISVHIRY